MIKIPGFWTNIAAQEERTGLIDVYDFETLRVFGNWADLGIVYAFPDVSKANFWGVINHDNGEGIFRIADNSVTPGLKIWTWGYPQTAELDPGRMRPVPTSSCGPVSPASSSSAPSWRRTPSLRSPRSTAPVSD